MSNCNDCLYLKIYRGSKDRYGVPQEPDECECLKMDDMSEEEFDKYFCDGEDGCPYYEMNDYDPYIDDYDNRW